jgi:imidazolonepropionase-like amidohydrolase
MFGDGSSQGHARRCRRFALAALLIAIATVSAAPAHDQVPGKPQARPILLRGGDLYTVSDGILESTDLMFEQGRITRIGADLTPPEGTEVIDVRGHRVYPGIIAPQSTLGLIEVGAVRATNDRTEVGSITPEAQAHIAFNPDSELIPTVRSHGITTAQIIPAGSLLRGRSFLTHLDGWTKEDSRVRLIDGVQVRWPSSTFRVGWWVEVSREEQKDAMDAERRILRRAFEDARAYYLAREASTPDQQTDLRWEAMLPLFRGELPVFIEANDYRQITDAVEFAQEFDLRIVLVGGKEAYKVTALLKEHDIPVIVGTTSTMPNRDGDAYDIAFRLPASLDAAGVRFCIAHIVWGAWDVRNLPFQAGQAVAHGLPADAALRAITLSTAEILGIDDQEGSLAVGKEATLFVSEGDVMDPSGQQVTRMFIRGRSVDLDDRHKELYRKYRQKP